MDPNAGFPGDPLAALSERLAGDQHAPVQPIEGGPFLLADGADVPACTSSFESTQSWFLPLYSRTVTLIDPESGSPVAADVVAMLEQRFRRDDAEGSGLIDRVDETLYFVTADTPANQAQGIQKDFWYPQATATGTLRGEAPARWVVTVTQADVTSGNPLVQAKFDDLPLTLSIDLWTAEQDQTRNLFGSGPASFLLRDWSCRPANFPAAAVDLPGLGYVRTPTDSALERPGRWLAAWEVQCSGSQWDTLAHAWQVDASDRVVVSGVARPNQRRGSVAGSQESQGDRDPGWPNLGEGSLVATDQGLDLSFPPDSSLSPGEFSGNVRIFMAEFVNVHVLATQPAVGFTMERCQ